MRAEYCLSTVYPFEFEVIVIEKVFLSDKARIKEMIAKCICPTSSLQVVEVDHLIL